MWWDPARALPTCTIGRGMRDALLAAIAAIAGVLRAAYRSSSSASRGVNAGSVVGSSLVENCEGVGQFLMPSLCAGLPNRVYIADQPSLACRRGDRRSRAVSVTFVGGRVD